MSIKGFSVGGVVQRYDYTALDNLPQGQGVSDDLKAALLQLARKVAYIDAQGQTYYDYLYNALYPEKTLLSIAANFQQGQAVVYNTDSLDTLKQYLTVTAVYDDASTEIVPSSAYTLSGTLTTGTSVITVTYEGKTDAFNVVVTAAPMSFPVTNNLTGCTTSNSASNVAEGSTYNAVITASSDYTLVGATVSITMGGTDITTSAYSGGVITISNVNGALIISVTAVERVLTSISAVYTQSGTVYDTDTLDSLKADLVVTANYSDGYTQTVLAADYTLSGTLTAGTSTITVSYGGKSDTFSVTVTSTVIIDQNVTMNGSTQTLLAQEVVYDATALYSWQYTFGTHTPVSTATTTNRVYGPVRSDGIARDGALQYNGSASEWRYVFKSSGIAFTPADGDVLTHVHNFATNGTSIYLNGTQLKSENTGPSYYNPVGKVVIQPDNAQMTVGITHIKIAKGDLH